MDRACTARFRAAVTFTCFSLIAAVHTASAQTINEWNVNGGGAFNIAGNWTMGVPAPDSTVLFGNVLTAANSPATINMSAPAALGEVQFNNVAATYVIGGASPLTLTGAAGVNVLGGTHEISATIAGSAGMVKAGGGTLILNSNNRTPG